MNEILIALITGGLSLLGVVVTNRSANDKMMHSMDVSQAVTDEKIAELTREVRALNHSVGEVPVMKEQLRSLDRRVCELEGYHKGA